ncbi:hypothetical protein [Chania multitudinisentens]|uniref:hypothetical protein n=1 Tax=Chania multitudinisentens TaxID=1639108 RepID=UPI0003E13F55|nr:hypothetical protein [Chania multitudinisentens]
MSDNDSADGMGHQPILADYPHIMLIEQESGQPLHTPQGKIVPLEQATLAPVAPVGTA